MLDECNHKPNKIWVNKDSTFYQRLIKSWLQDNDIKMYSTYNEGKSVAAERFIRTINNTICNYMTSKSKNAYIGKLDDIENEQYIA